MRARSDGARLRRPWRPVARSVGLFGLVAAAYFGCSFPEHTFIPDEQFDLKDASADGKAASSGAAGTSATGGAGGSTGGTTANGEDCRNGIDDNGNGLIDCADPGCTAVGFQCATLPADWTGPVALYIGDPNAAPNCAGDYPTIGASLHQTLSALPATCNACNPCGAPTGTTCASPEINFFEAGNCGGNGLTFYNLPSTGCFTADMSPGSGASIVPVSANATGFLGQGGACSASGGGVQTLPQATWSDLARACAFQTGGWLALGCGTTDLCLPPAGREFGAGTCIFKTGDNPCPGTTFTTRHVLYSDFTDTRGCDPCGCDVVTGVVCHGKVDIMDNPANCSNPTATITDFSGNQCVTVSNSQVKLINWTIDTGYPQGGSCASIGGGPSGSATPINPTTFCCI